MHLIVPMNSGRREDRIVASPCPKVALPRCNPRTHREFAIPKILAVDDDPGVLDVVQKTFQAAGHSVETASSGPDALQKARSAAFDVAIVDFDVPAPNGLEVLHILRELQPSCLRILFSGKLDMPAVLEAVNRGEVARILEKPMRPSELADAVLETLEHHRRMEALARGNSSEEQRAQLRECLENDHLSIAIQPIVDAQTSDVVAYEALMRSSHAVLDNPTKVLNAAESYDMIGDVASALVPLLLSKLTELPSEPLLFLNLHPMELGDPESLERRLAPLRPYAERLVIEITERSRLADFGAWKDSVATLTSLGFSIAVDDLGAGYNSLSILAALQPSFIKVDMSIVRDVHRDNRKRELVNLLCGFAETSNARLIAEGVESEEEAQTLRGCGAHFLQGYLFGKPTTGPVC